MPTEFEPVHGFRLNVSKRKGERTIFILRVFPEGVLDLKPVSPSGAEITVKMANDDPITWEVTQSVDEIRAMIARCKELDAQEAK